MRFWGVLILLLVATAAFVSDGTSRSADPEAAAGEAPADADSDTDDTDDDWVPDERGVHLTLVLALATHDVSPKLQHLAVSGIDRPPCIRAS